MKVQREREFVVIKTHPSLSWTLRMGTNPDAPSSPPSASVKRILMKKKRFLFSFPPGWWIKDLQGSSRTQSLFNPGLCKVTPSSVPKQFFPIWSTHIPHLPPPPLLGYAKGRGGSHNIGKGIQRCNKRTKYLDFKLITRL